MVNALAVAVGGALGAVLRYAVGQSVPAHLKADFPYHTLIVNVTGAFLLGVLMTLAVERGPLPEWAKLFAGVGILGGYTTFSTLAFETVDLAHNGAMAAAFANAAGSLVAGLLAVVAGIYVGRLL